MINRRNLSHFALACFLSAQLCFFSGCIKPDHSDITDDEPLEIININLEDLDFKVFQIVMLAIELDDDNVNSQEYNGILGDMEISLLRYSSSELLFIVPDIPAGDYNLKIEAGKKLAVGKIRIKAGEIILNPELYVDNYVKNTIEAFDEILLLEGLPELPLGLKEIKDAMLDAQRQFATLSDNEKVGVARFLQNNEELFIAVEQAYANLTKKQSEVDVNNIVETTIIVAGGVLLAKSLAISGSVAAGTLAVFEVGFRILTGRSSPIFRKVKAAVSDILGMVYFPQNLLADVVYDKAAKTFTNFSDETPVNGSNAIKKTKSYEQLLNPDPFNSALHSNGPLQYSEEREIPVFRAGEKVTFSIKPTYRTLLESDADSSDEFVAGLVSIYNELLSLWNESFMNRFGVLPGFELKTEKIFADSLSKFSIRVDSLFNHVSGLIIDGDAKAFNATFTSNIQTNTVVVFDIEYTDKGITAKERIDAVLIVEPSVPHFLEKISGDNQTGYLGQQLAEPLVVSVNDQYGIGMPGVVVSFKSENFFQSSFSEDNAISDENGIVRVFWKLGTTDRDQTVTVRSPDISSAIYFSATGQTSCSTFISDGYEATQIGNQIWMARNLNRIVTGSYAYPGLGAEYGRSYTWDAAQKVCPSGWRLPSDEDWNTLFSYLANNGFSGTEARALKATYDWNTGSGLFSGNGTDSFCFSALPGGQYDPDSGSFDGVINYGVWWGSSVFEPGGNQPSIYGRRVFIYADHISIFTMDYQDKKFGLSVRCVKN